MNQAGLKRLNTSQLSPQDRQQRNQRNKIAKSVRYAFKPAWTLNALLRRSLSALNVAHDCGDAVDFALHPAWVQECLGQRLVLQIPLEKIRFHMADWLELGDRRLHTSDYFLAYGDLVPARYEMSRLPVLREVQELMAAGWQCEHTPTYAQLVKAMEQQRPVVRQQIRLDSLEKIQAYFQRFHALHASVAQHGVLSNKEVAQKLGLESDREIGIALDRDGAVVKLHGGKHRFALAVAHQLKTIPVELRMVHAQALSEVCLTRGCSPVQAIVWLVKNLESNLEHRV
ncbi:hypothetical protein [Comamonas sp. NoAH]|uniref:hypothetical protein n=1 Tax=Comamonas halotolerans TaxID=3041496 RepID=UPI0024E12BD9|nr:hypothetical protein [Comamonas sp. NoAH]